MALWEHETSDTINGTDEMLTALATWLNDGGRGWAGDPGTITCPTVIGDSSSGGAITICSNLTNTPHVIADPGYPRWDVDNGVLPQARQKLWRFEKSVDAYSSGPIDFWMVLDTDVDRSMGLFALLTETVGVSANNFRTLVYEPGHPNLGPAIAIIPNNPTAPRFSSVYPAFGAFKYHFFSNGLVVHVAFCRNPNSTWQHFSFGTLNKAVSTVEGGEYFSGNCAGDSTYDCWDYSGVDGHKFGANNASLLSSTTRQRRYSLGNDNFDPCGKGILRVVGVQDAYLPAARLVNYCALGDPLLALNSTMDIPDTVGVTTDAAGSAAILGGLGAWQEIKGRTNTPLVDGNPSLATQDLCPNTWDKRAPGIGVDVLVYEDARWQMLGSVPGVRFLNIAYLNEESVVNTDWIAFPLTTQLPADKQPGSVGHTCSGNLGVAYRFAGY